MSGFFIFLVNFMLCFFKQRVGNKVSYMILLLHIARGTE